MRKTSSDSSIWKRLRHNRYFWMASGFFGCILVAGVLALVMNFVIQPLSTPETWGTVKIREDHLTLWHAEDSASLEDHSRIAIELEAAFVDLVTFLDIDRATLPLPIDVFVHDSIPAMQMSIARRKSRQASTYFNAPVDIIDGRPMRPQLAEVLLSQGWGPCFTQAVYLATLLYVSNPESDFLCTVAAAPAEMRHSVRELLQMEMEDRYPKTAYQQLGDPSAPRALLSLEDWHMLYFVSDTMASLAMEDFPRTELASIVQYLAETSGDLSALKNAWGPGTAETLLVNCFSQSLLELDSAWQERIKLEAGEDCAPEALRARLLYEAGHIEDAYLLTQTWTPGPGTLPEDCLLAAHCALTTGEFDQAAEWTEWLEEPVRAELENLVANFQGWRKSESAELVLLSPETAADRGLYGEIRETYQAICQRADAPVSADLRPFIFIHPNEESKKIGIRLHQGDADLSVAVHLCPEDDWAFEIAHSLLPRLWGTGPVSPLARVGVASLLACPVEILTERGVVLNCESGWEPMLFLDVGTGREDVLRTEMGLLFAYLEQTMGLDAVKRIWTESRAAGSVTLESSLRKILGTSKSEIETALRNRILACPPPPSPVEESSS